MTRIGNVLTGAPTDMGQAIIEYLARLQPPFVEHDWPPWHIWPVTSGNNRLFRVARDADDWVVKFMIRDERDRARREFNALSLMSQLAVDIAPRPIHLDLDRHEQAVVVQTWVPGTPLWSPPPDDATWLQILHAYRRVHLAQAPGGTKWEAGHGPLLSPLSPADMVTAIHELSLKIPPEGQSERLRELNQILEHLTLPSFPETRCWAHGDPNIRNLILTANGVKLVVGLAESKMRLSPALRV